MRILIIAKKGISLTGAGTYEANVVRELSRRHEVKVLSSDADLNEDWDVAHCTDLKHLTFHVAKKLRCPLVVDAHDYYWSRFYPFFCLDFPLRFLIQKYRKLKYRMLFRHIDGIILHGQFLYDLYQHPNKYLNFYFGLDFSQIRDRSWSARENLILFVGGDYFRKGLPRLLKALPLVLAKVPDARVMVIGQDYAYAKTCAKLLARGLPVEIIPGLPREEVYALYSRARVMVLPSEIEATPITVAEALRGGAVPVLSNVGGHPELIKDGETGFLFDLKDTRTLASRIISGLTDETLSARLIANGRQFMDQFTVDKMINQIETVYADVVKKTVNGRLR